MQTLIGTVVVVAAVMAAMAVGVMWHGRPLKGSCGGPNQSCPCTETERQSCAKRARDTAS
ncbi:hypothetical protein MK489_07265 [Myxococcota bacterium]|nr:hypothetical protein [Myxococcota bacterium]